MFQVKNSDHGSYQFINRPNYSVKDAEKGSRFVVGSPAAFVDDAEEVIWIDCFNGTPKACCSPVS